MDLRISYNWLKEYCDTKLKPAELAKQLSLHSFNVERIHHEGRNLDRVVVSVIKELKKHPNADKLRVCTVDAGQERDLKIVCGAPNIYDGMKVIVALIGAKVQWHGEGELVELKPAVIRGESSEGMICGANEVGLAEMFPDFSDGVPDLKFSDAKPGTPLAKALDLTDSIYDMEITSNRPDALGICGLAMEAAACTGSKFIGTTPPKLPAAKSKLSLKLQIIAKDLCYRYTGAVISGVKVGPSPWWLQKRLRQVGLRPINNIVDVTNYVLLEYGQPMHAFDYEKVGGSEIIVRPAKAGEKILALDGKTYQLKDSHLVIADASRPMAIAGIMGGQETAISDRTTKIVLESAIFNPVSIRRTARALNLHSDASARFEKGLHTEGTQYALARAAELILKLAGGEVASDMLDKRTKEYKPRKISLDLATVNNQIGLQIPAAKVKSILKSLNFTVTGAAKKLSVLVPAWRHEDIETDRDLVEEVARMYGYHNLPSVLPAGRLPEAMPNANLKWEGRVKEILASVGLTEIYSYSFVSEKMLRNLGLDPANCLRLNNPLNDDMVYMRPALIPSLLQIVGENEGLNPEQSLFELSNVYRSHGLKELPDEVPLLSVVLTGKDYAKLFSRAKGLIEHLCVKLGIAPASLNWQPMKESGPFVPSVSGSFMKDGELLGAIGAIKEEIAHKFKIKNKVVAFSIDAAVLTAMATDLKKFKPLPKFPSVNLDLALVVKKNITWGQINDVVKQTGGKTVESVELFDLFEGKGIPPDSKSIAFHLIYRSPEKTLELSEAQNIHSKIIKNLEQKLNAQVRAAPGRET